MTAHITRNMAACSSTDWRPMLIHAIDIDHPPGMGIPDAMPRAEWMV
jgi:hypothetical protein